MQNMNGFCASNLNLTYKIAHLELSYWEAEFPPKYPNELGKMYIQGCSSQHCSSLEKTGNHPNVHP